MFAFSRNEGMHPNFVLAQLQPREMDIFCEYRKLAAPLSFFRSFWLHFRVHWTRKRGQVLFALIRGLFRSVRRFEVKISVIGQVKDGEQPAYKNADKKIFMYLPIRYTTSCSFASSSSQGIKHSGEWTQFQQHNFKKSCHSSLKTG